MRLFLVLTLVCGLCSCSGFSYVYKNYGGVKVLKHHGPDFAIRVFDKPEEGRMMVTPTLGSSMAQGAVAGWTLGMVDTSGSKRQMQTQAQDFLDHNERNATIYKGDMILKPQWEFWYRSNREIMAKKE